jgi:hypothetical protein
MHAAMHCRALPHNARPHQLGGGWFTPPAADPPLEIPAPDRRPPTGERRRPARARVEQLDGELDRRAQAARSYEQSQLLSRGDVEAAQQAARSYFSASSASSASSRSYGAPLDAGRGRGPPVFRSPISPRRAPDSRSATDSRARASTYSVSTLTAASDFSGARSRNTVWARRGRLSALGAFDSKSLSYGAFCLGAQGA